MNDLMSKLAISKAIMDKHNGITRGSIQEGSSHINNLPELEEFSSPEAKYNIPQDFLQETTVSKPINTEVPTNDRILNSKLPDEIKKLMIENPIEPKNPLSAGGSVLSDELVEKASKLMGTQKKETPQRQNQGQPVLSNDTLRQMMKEVVQEVLKENGLLVESSNKSNETITFKVGKHIFEGKVTKIKKLQ